MNGSSRTVYLPCVPSQIRDWKNAQSSSPSIRLCCPKPWAHTVVNGQPEEPMQKYEILIEANSKPHDIVVRDGSVTRDRSGWVFTIKRAQRLSLTLS